MYSDIQGIPQNVCPVYMAAVKEVYIKPSLFYIIL